ncbi:TonB-dependent receptor [Asticcacaulis sp. DXS10W]|uniref:TonB-dependent receptor n=1 Tax=Asticcacaulis currens TaxID=2984210 RepID=A0ABT5IBF8_9CAUL|nr:TonB-dependent receptor [Asticcacaulis currens]MDC7693512.1 TonB-dependent receptor [Asticcacaulis currens]
MRNLRATMLSSACLMGLGLFAPAMAEDVSAVSGKEASATDVTEVVVTATKKRETLQSVPSSIDAVTAQTIEKLNIQSFQDVQKVTAGLELNTADGRGQNISLRGVSFDPDTGASPTVQVYWNETPISTATAFRGLFDVGQIEVLKGPQGTLRGQTSPAGAITIASKRPNLSFREGTVTQTIGSLDKVNTQLAGNLPLIEGKLSLRVAVLYDHSRDGVENIINGRENSNMSHGARASLLYKPSSDLEILLVHQDVNNRVVNYRPAIGAPLTSAGQAPGRTLTVADHAAIAEGDADFYNNSKLTSLNVTWDVIGHRLSYIGGYQQTQDASRRDQDFTNVISGYNNYQNTDLKAQQTTHELRFESVNNPRWNYMVGAYYSRSSFEFQLAQTLSYFYISPYGPVLTTEMTGFNRPGNYAKGYALFTNHRFALTDKDQLELGLRWQKNESDGNSYISVFGNVIPSVPESQSYRETKGWTGSASYRHTFSRDLMAYASYGRGLRPGGLTSFVTAQGLNPAYLSYKDEVTDAIEVGVKSKWFDRRLTFNASLFKQDVKDYIGRANNVYVRVAAQPNEPAGPGVGGSYFYDAATGGINLNTNGDVEATGIEALVAWAPTANWSTQLNLSYVDAHYVNALLYCNDSNNDGIPDEAAPFVQRGRQVSVCPSNRGLINTDQNIPGKLNASLQSEYSWNVGNLDLFARGLVRYVAPMENQRNGFRISAYAPVDLYLGVRQPNQKWELSAWAQNLFDEDRNMGAFAQFQGAAAGGYLSSYFPDQRKYGVTLRYNFGQ